MMVSVDKPDPVLNYASPTPRTRNRPWAIIVPAAVSGILCGLAWFSIGERLDNVFPNFVAWFFVPLVPPVVPSILASVYLKRPSRSRLTTFALFYGAWGLGHFLPYFVLYGFFVVFGLLGGTM